MKQINDRRFSVELLQIKTGEENDRGLRRLVGEKRWITLVSNNIRKIIKDMLGQGKTKAMCLTMKTQLN